MKQTIRLNFDFPRKFYPDLRKACALRGKTLKDFATDLLIREIEEMEDIMLTKKARARLAAMDEKDNIDFNEAAKLAGWDDDEV